MRVRRKAASVNSEAWLPVVPQLNKLQKQVAHFCHSLVTSFFSTLQRGSSTSKVLGFLLRKMYYFYFISLGFVGFLFGKWWLLFFSLSEAGRQLDCGWRSEEKAASALLLWKLGLRCYCGAIMKIGRRGKSSRSSKWKMTFGFQNMLVASRKIGIWTEGFSKWYKDLPASMIFAISVVLALSGSITEAAW